MKVHNKSKVNKFDKSIVTETPAHIIPTYLVENIDKF